MRRLETFGQEEYRIDNAILYLEEQYSKLNIPPLKEFYSASEMALLLACDHSTVLSLIHAKLLISGAGRGRGVIPCRSLIDFLDSRKRNVYRPIDDVLFQGMISPASLAEEIKVKLSNLDYLIRTGKLPSFNIGVYERPYYRLPLIETKIAFKKLKQQLFNPKKTLESYI